MNTILNELCLYHWWIAISWRSTKQTLVALGSNNVKMLVLNEAAHECTWLRAVVEHIRSTHELSSIVDVPTMIFEDNFACINQIRKEYIKGDHTKHIAS